MDSSSVEKLARRSRLLDAAGRILVDTLQCETVTQVAALGLAAIEDLVGSEFGFVDELNAQGTLDALALSDIGWKACSQEPERARKQLAGLPIRGYWSRPVVTGEPIVVNNPTSHPERLGTPEGHPPIVCYLGVPTKHGARIVGVIGLAKKPGRFEQSDEDLSVVSSYWKICTRYDLTLRTHCTLSGGIQQVVLQVAVSHLKIARGLSEGKGHTSAAL